MSYEKLGFVSGQTLMAEHLNHMEDGIANAGGVSNTLIIKLYYDTKNQIITSYDTNMSLEDCMNAIRNLELAGAFILGDYMHATDLTHVYCVESCTVSVYSNSPHTMIIINIDPKHAYVLNKELYWSSFGITDTNPFLK